MVALFKQAESIFCCPWWAQFPVKSNLEPSFSDAHHNNLATHNNIRLPGKKGGDV